MADATQIRITAVDQTTAAFRSVQSNLNLLSGSLKSIAGPLAAAFSIGAIANFSKNIINAADRLSDLSAVTGFTVEQLSALGNAAQLNGSSADALNQGLVRLSKSIAEAGAGAQEQLKAFNALGISQDELKNKAPIDIFFKVADAYEAAADGAEKIAVSNALGGRSFSELIPLLNQGSEAIKKYESTFTTQQAEKFAEFNDNVDKLSLNLQKMAVTVLGPVIEGVNSFFKSLEAGNKRLKADTEGLVGTFDMFLDDYPARVEQATSGVVGSIDKINKQFEKKPVKPKLVFDDSAEKSALEALVERNKELVDVYNKTRQPVDILSDGLSRLNQLYDQGYISLDQYLDAQMQLQEAFQNTQPKIDLNDTALRKYSASAKNLQDSLQSAAVNGLRSLEDALIGVYTGTMTVKDAFKSMAISIIQDLIRIQIQRSITGPIADALSGLFSAGNTTSGAPLGSGITLPGRAMGGTVQSGGAYMVGERGPELFIPGRTGSIVPNDDLSGGGPVVNQTLQISVGVSQTVRAEVMNMLPRIMEATKAAVADSKRRGGTFGKMMST